MRLYNQIVEMQNISQLGIYINNISYKQEPKYNITYSLLGRICNMHKCSLHEATSKNTLTFRSLSPKARAPSRHNTSCNFQLKYIITPFGQTIVCHN